MQSPAPESYGASNFITTEPPSGPGRDAEQRTWDAVRAAYSQQPCLGYWRYPIFDNTGGFSKEPDVLLAHPDLDIVVIEVKGVTIDRTETISGHKWTYRDRYVASDAPHSRDSGAVQR